VWIPFGDLKLNSIVVLPQPSVFIAAEVITH